ncbi:hypothetical protein ACFL47_08720 [Candidatus Latescibacterota bacterium]
MSFLKTLFGAREGWDLIPDNITEQFREKMSVAQFEQFTKLCIKYDIFPQMSRALNSEMQKIALVSFLTNVGNGIAQAYEQSNDRRQEMLLEAIEFSKSVHLFDTDWYPARIDLALMYMQLDRMEEAKEEAQKAISGMDRQNDKSMRDKMVKISNGQKINI